MWGATRVLLSHDCDTTAALDCGTAALQLSLDCGTIAVPLGKLGGLINHDCEVKDNVD